MLILDVGCLWEILDIRILALPLASCVIEERTWLLCSPFTSSVNATPISTSCYKSPMSNANINAQEPHKATQCYTVFGDWVI